MANGYVSQVQLPNNETYDIKDKNAVKNITNSDIPGNINFTKGEETKDILVKDFGTAYGIDCYKGKLPLDFTSPGGVIDEWKIYGNSSGPTEVLETQSTLPVGIDTYGGNAVDWEIYGNNNPVIETESNTLPIDISSNGGNAVDWVIYGNDDNGTENLVFTYLDSASIGANGVIGGNDVYDLAVAPVTNGVKYSVLRNYTETGNCVYGFFTEQPTYSSTTYNNNRSMNSNVSFSFTAPITGFVALWSFKATNRHQTTVVKGSTAPDHYIPYQKGAGERTENLLPFTNGTKTSNNVSAVCAYGSYTITIGEDETVFTELYFDIPPVTFPNSVGAGGMGILSFFNTAKTGISICFRNSGTIVQRFELNSESRVFDNYTDLGGATINRISFRVQANTAAGSLTVKPMLTDDSTVPDSFIPHGYQIPITVSQQGQTDKTYDIYIGENPLTEGETVSKTSTGVDIELFSGDNIIDTSLYNKPNTSITYNSSVLGVGENTEITGELPIDFRSNGDDLLGYRIYGTADGSGVQTENVADISASALIQVNAQGAMRYGVIVPDIPAGEWTISMNTPVRNPYYLVKRVGSVYTNIGNTSGLFVPQTITLDEQCDLIIRTASPIEITWEDYFGVNLVNMMVTKGSIPPSIYIPYGYKLPLTVTNGTETKTTDIYIGDSKLGEAEYVDYGEQKIYKRILFMTHDGKHFITKDNKDFCLRRRGYNG